MEAAAGSGTEAQAGQGAGSRQAKEGAGRADAVRGAVDVVTLMSSLVARLKREGLRAHAALYDRQIWRIKPVIMIGGWLMLQFAFTQSIGPALS